MRYAFGGLLLALYLVASPAPGMAAGRSPGCGQPPPETPPRNMEVAGHSRRLTVALPADYDPDRAYRLVLGFHGRTTTADQARRYYGLEAADDGSTIFVYPQGLRRADGTFQWRVPEDLALFDAILDRLGRRYCIATNEVFAVGHSMGASFVNSLACARGRVLRAIATVAGSVSRTDCSGRVAALLLHNPKDRLVPIAQGRSALDMLLNQNGLSQASVRYRAGPFSCQRYGGRAQGNPVIWCPYEQDFTRRGRYYPHLWPDGAGLVMMRFFAGLD